MVRSHPVERVTLAPLSLQDKPRFDRAFAALAQPLSDYTFANVFIWGGSMRLTWAAIDRHLCVFANGTAELTLLLPPIPEPDARPADLRRALETALSLMHAHSSGTHPTPGASGGPAAGGSDAGGSASGGGGPRIEYVSDEMLERVSEAAGDLNLAATPMSGDFIYPVEAMIHLPGKKLKSKRSGKAQFERRYPNHRTAALTDAHRPACFALLDRWQRHADARHVGQRTEDAAHVATASLRTRESDACRMALEHHAALGLTGMVVFVDDRLVGFTLGERLSPVQASILFEKTDPDFAGLPQFIFAEFCRTAWADCPEINVGDDWGIPTLRFTKESYRPTRRLAKYTLAPRAMATPQPVSADALPPRIVPLSRRTVPAAAPETPTRRAARFTDVRDLVALERNCFGDGDAFRRRQVRELVRNPLAICRVIEVEGRVEAWAVALVRRHAAHRSGRLYSLAVDPAQRGRGFAARLLREVLAELEAAGVRHVYLEVAVDNNPAIALYERFGFRPVRRLPDYYAPESDALSMRRTLAPPPTS